MRQGFIAMSLNAGNFSFELGDPLAQLVVRIAIKALGGEQAGRVIARTGAIIVVHCANFGPLVLAVNWCRR